MVHKREVERLGQALAVARSNMAAKEALWAQTKGDLVVRHYEEIHVHSSWGEMHDKLVQVEPGPPFHVAR